ncbi:lysozyme inhibitor LprI family protein [Bradyrhizobium brasilense]|uniref:lysozyme inhibitor LprI family protein n=1 Tax=Bradyrhizobium brasilense TaxID=1419277 RepID=UPI0024B18F8F|nr:lysozyme inhibitor LprI family protein [Bradyrhizobium australafricanum]WFU35052.1 lysozyme inhibitor LprI family protein [Bradyrhizobium australafricanum]
MPCSPRFAAAVAAIAVLASGPSVATDDDLRASSSGPTAIRLCGDSGDGTIKTADCRKAGTDRLVTQIDRAFDAALGRMPANIKPLLKRDQTWFNEMIIDAAEVLADSDADELKESFAQALRRRAAALEGMASGRPGFAGNWVNAFGNITLTPADGGAYRLAADLRGDYGGDRRRSCKLTADLKPAGSGWLAGTVVINTDTAADKPKADAAAAPARPPSLKLRRQGETLRIVGSIDDEEWDGFADCSSMWQVTGSYFAAGKDTASDSADTAFVVPTFDCTRPETATDEEICADPDLADNDRRLNRAWKALQPHLDEATRRALIDDQRNWVKSQAQQYPEFLHPAWNKQSSQVHFTVDARDHVDGLQRERLALLEGFDDKRGGLAGIWLAHNAIIKITTESNGAVKATGWKWDQGDWKAGCDYEMTGKIVGGTFRSDEQRKNPDTLERDHAMLIVNRQDDLFAKKRYSNKDGTENKDADEAKCKRRLDNSSTARMFPARPSPDIDNFKGSIR